MTHATAPDTADNPSDDDSQILARFGEWIEARRADGRCASCDDEGHRHWDRAQDIEREINGIPATSATGLAVKMYLHLHADELWYHAGGAALAGCDAHDLSYSDVRSKLSILKDIIWFAPELQPLASDYINAVPLLPFGDLKGPVPGDVKEEARRARIIYDERRQLLEKVWAVRPVTNADYWEAERQVMASHPDWYFESAEERDEEKRKAEAERKAAERKELAELLAKMDFSTKTWPADRDKAKAPSCASQEKPTSSASASRRKGARHEHRGSKRRRPDKISVARLARCLRCASARVARHHPLPEISEGSGV